jgi:hypothetical protein
MKAEHSSILIFGHDEHLLLTRQWVLQSRGYRVLTASTLSNIDSIPKSPPIKLLLLCHSLDPVEVATARNHAQLRWPNLKCLELVADDSRAPSGILGQLLHTMDGPAKLVTLVDNLVGSSTPLANHAQR